MNSNPLFAATFYLFGVYNLQQTCFFPAIWKFGNVLLQQLIVTTALSELVPVDKRCLTVGIGR